MAELPAVPPGIQPGLRRFLDRLREALSGDGGAVTAGELARAAIAVRRGSRLEKPGATLPPPPAPEGVAAAGAFDSVILSWDAPRYRGHAFAEIWRADSSGARGDAVLAGTAAGAVFADAGGGAGARRYWLRFANEEGTRGPFDSLAGTEASRAADPAWVLDNIAGRVGEGSLDAALRGRVSLVDAPASTPGSVAARVAAVQAQVSELARLPAWDAATAYAEGALVRRFDRLYRATRATTGDDPDNRQNSPWEVAGDFETIGDAVIAQGNQIASMMTELGASVSRLESLAAQLRGSYEGTDAAAVTEGLVFSEREARVAAGAAAARRIDGIVARARDLEASVTEEREARVAADGNLAARWVLRVDANNHVAGIGLAASGAAGSEFVVRADRFRVASPFDAEDVSDLFVVFTSRTTNNGVDILPGAYIRDAFIANGAITNAKIGTLAVDDANIRGLSAAKITAGIIDADRIGAATITAEKIDARGLVVRDANGDAILGAGTPLDGAAWIRAGTIGSAQIAEEIRSSNYAPGAAGWRIAKDGTAELNEATFRGAIEVDSGSGSRLAIHPDRIEVWDGENLRVRMGNLSPEGGE